MAAEELFPELSWFCTLLFFAVIVMLLATCVCLKEQEKTYVYGTAGRLSITKDSPVIQHQPRNGTGVVGLKQTSIHSTEDINPKRNSWTVKDRALPEIPDATDAPIIVTSNLVSDAKTSSADNALRKETNHVKVKSHNKALAPKPPGIDKNIVLSLVESPSTSQGESSHVSVTITVNDKPQFIENKSPQPLRVKPKLAVAESNPSTSGGAVSVKRVKVQVTDSPSRTSDDFYDTVPESSADSVAQAASLSSSPVRIRIGAPLATEIVEPSSPSASLAVSGAVASSDIPYMTPPLLHNPPSSANGDRAQESTASAERSEVPYTVISVREPLARVREITMKKQRAAVQQNSEDSDDHYALVPEEEQMYAEIGSGHDSGSSSITYAHIEPRELPPVPPTVESLKSVAHAHSRQASTVSTSSFGSGLSSGGEPSTPPILRNPSSLYSSIEKGGKQRKTIHVAEGASLVSTMEKRKKVEDLYAKVRKKRVDLTINTSSLNEYSSYEGILGENTECLTPPPSPWASTTPPAPPPITGRLQAASLSVLFPGSGQHIRRHSADPNFAESIEDGAMRGGDKGSHALYSRPSKGTDEPGYESVYNEQDNSEDSCYEKIKDKSESSGREPGYESVKQSRSNEDANFPGYASVSNSTGGDYSSLDPGYECVAQMSSEADPGYEPVRTINMDDSDTNSNYSVVKLDDDSEPGYEMVQKYSQGGSERADPGYEKIRKVPRVNSDATDPGYEKVRNKLTDACEPGYATVDRSDSDTEPGYEIVHHDRKRTNSRYASGHSSRTSQSNNSTVLYVSGKSDTTASRGKSSSTGRGGSPAVSEPDATFL